MEKQEFTYMVEPGSNNGFVWVFEGHQKEEEDGVLFFYEEKDLIEILKQYKKGSVIVLEDNKKLLIEGERLANKLNLEFQHP